jgi:hypothetical protein
MVMYFSPLILTPFAMTALVSLLSLKEAAMALISAAVSWNLLALSSYICHYIRPGPARCWASVYSGAKDRIAYREVWGRGPGSLAIDIANEGLVDVAGADEAVRKGLETVLINNRIVCTSDQRMLKVWLAVCAARTCGGCLPCQDMFMEGEYAGYGSL